jgi:hypothetical protein
VCNRFRFMYEEALEQTPGPEPDEDPPLRDD